MYCKTTLFAAFAASLRLVAAAPAPQLIAPYGTDVTLCTGSDFKGSCIQLFVEHDQCTAFPVGFQNDVSSMSLLEGWSCTLFMSTDCDVSAGSFNVDWTGDYSHMKFGDNAFNSLTCTM